MKHRRSQLRMRRLLALANDKRLDGASRRIVHDLIRSQRAALQLRMRALAEAHRRGN